MPAVSAVVSHRVHTLAVKIGSRNIPPRAVPRRPQQKRSLVRADQQKHVPIFHLEVFHPPEHQRPWTSRFFRGMPALQHRALQRLQSRAHFAGPLVTLRRLLHQAPLNHCR